MNLPSILLWGFVATIVLTTVMAGSQGLGYTRMSIPFLLEIGTEEIPGWELMNGYSGQDRYAGPIMHNSEFIGGQMERDILETPGIYVALVCYWPDAEESDEDETYAEGWAVARKVAA